MPLLKIQYREKHHRGLPHVVKFSGGRSSGYMLHRLLKSKSLKPERGDVIVFNNTAAEHPYTYDFVAKWKQLAEQDYGIPFFWIEFATYEDSQKGRWRRIPSYKLVQATPNQNGTDNGYHWKGEVFEEVLSYTGFVPSRTERVCTLNMKITATEKFLSEWFALKPSTERLGHFGNSKRATTERLYSLHLSNRGATPKDIFEKKKKYVVSRPHIRQSQHYASYTNAKIVHLNNPYLNNKKLGITAPINGENATEYISLLGIRSDEEPRIQRITARGDGNLNGRKNPDGEQVYMPLATAKITKKQVLRFWQNHPWDLEIPHDVDFSNCVFCFLKGGGILHHCLYALQQNKHLMVKNTPSDIGWWIKMEKKYGRDLIAEQRHTKDGNDFYGFFGISSPTRKAMSYKQLRQMANTQPKNLTDDIKKILAAQRPCDCTD